MSEAFVATFTADEERIIRLIAHYWPGTRITLNGVDRLIKPATPEQLTAWGVR